MTNKEAIGRLEIIKKCYPFRYEEGVEFRNALDLAIKALEERPTVETGHYLTNCQNCQSDYSRGYDDGYKEGYKAERPQGKWVMEGKPFDDGLGDSVLVMTCSICKESFVYRGTTPNYCPNCGAKMGKEEV